MQDNTISLVMWHTTVPPSVSPGRALGQTVATCNKHSAARPRLFTFARFPQAAVHITDILTSSVECVAVTVHVGGTDTCVASVYVQPVRQWDMSYIVSLAVHIGGDCVVCRDCNSHPTTWGSSHTESRGRDLLESISSAGLLLVNTGSPLLFVELSRRALSTYPW